MKILILGGTGAVGKNMVDLLSNTDNEIVITSRTKRESHQNVRYIEGNAKSTLFITNILEEYWDVIIDFMVYTTLEFTERVILLLNATSQYIFLSSARVYANSKGSIKETSPRLLDISTDQEFLSSDEYSLTKARQENLLKESGRSNWTIIRPYITYSSQRLQLGVFEKESWLYRALKRRTIVFASDIHSKLTTMTSGLDVAKGIITIIGNRYTLGETFNITSTRSILWSDVLNIYLNVLENHLGSRPKLLLDNIENFHSYYAAKYQINYDRLFNREFDNSKISKYVNVESFISSENGLKECLEDFLKNPIFKGIDWRAEALKDRRTKEIAKLSEISGFKQKIKYLLYRFLIN
ncbi:MAG: epimerase [Bacteroidia bacterium 43-41]|nr:MAG: epimerase [Bacteroidia bacterium 43-41]